MVVRCRPLNTKEKGNKEERCVDIDPTAGTMMVRNMKNDEGEVKNYTFDLVYDWKWVIGSAAVYPPHTHTYRPHTLPTSRPCATAACGWRCCPPRPPLKHQQLPRACSSIQSVIYEETAKPIVQAVIEGFNGESTRMSLCL